MDVKNFLLVKTGLAAYKREKNRIPRVLFYHGVSDIHTPFVESLHIPPEEFKRQLEYLQLNFDLISMDEYYRRWRSNSFTGEEATLTFDDGYRNNLTFLAPILQDLNIPFTVFIATHHIDTGKRFSTFIGRAVVMHPEVRRLNVPAMGLDVVLTSARQRKKVFKVISHRLKHSEIKTVDLITDQLIGQLSSQQYQQLCSDFQADALMTWKDVITLQSYYDCTIGSHCLDHFICDTFQETAEIQRQIIESKKVIEEKLEIPCHYLAYPNGNVCPAALDAAKEAGYRLAFTTDNVRVTPEISPFAMPRYGVDFHWNTFVADLSFKPK
ncbi:polysaccharide deacetylase family protein [Oscillospiraceae bacterium N12]|jgi:peptidoglycan/xylan/chitin deacetylase (PgdA/CDA1 family)|uniref:Polysaccharide deacetylase family protein n=1 Tax=Jilunia laotingensis TaxID=2763675 RepID=A0A926F5G8_9BACT|nr:polysaccharide deacetylase family protein [Jilunia laotingensis]MBC8593282.1 polysaccharide deacetylase family protein [Jilunia laotingensis]